MSVATKFKDGLAMIFVTLLVTSALIWLYFKSNALTKYVITNVIFVIYSAWTLYGVWEITHSTLTLLLSMFGLALLYSFFIFIFVKGKSLQTWFYYLTLLLIFMLAVAGFAVLVLAENCQLQMEGEKSTNNSQGLFYVLALLLVVGLYVEGHTALAAIAFVISLSIHNHYAQWHIGDILHCF